MFYYILFKRNVFVKEPNTLLIHFVYNIYIYVYCYNTRDFMLMCIECYTSNVYAILSYLFVHYLFVYHVIFVSHNKILYILFILLHVINPC